MTHRKLNDFYNSLNPGDYFFEELQNCGAISINKLESHKKDGSCVSSKIIKYVKLGKKQYNCSGDCEKECVDGELYQFEHVIKNCYKASIREILIEKI